MAALNIVPASHWETDAQPVRGPTLRADRINETRHHWPGRPWLKNTHDRASTAAWLREEQARALRTRGYSYYYNFYIPRYATLLRPDLWAIRGLGIMSAATAGVNEISLAVQYECAPDAPPTAGQIDVGILFVRLVDQRFGLNLAPAYPHNGFGATTATECPGPGVRAELPRINARRLSGSGTPPTEPPTEEEEDMLKHARIVGMQGVSARWVVVPLVAKWMIPDSGTRRRIEENIAWFGGNPTYLEVEEDRMRSFGPITAGPRPASVDGWGVPL